MTFQDFKDLKDSGQLSDTASDTVDNIIDLRDEADMNDDADEIAWQECDKQFIYYADAWQYLQDNEITDFTEAIENMGCKDINAIATYYLMNELGIC